MFNFFFRVKESENVLKLFNIAVQKLLALILLSPFVHQTQGAFITSDFRERFD